MRNESSTLYIKADDLKGSFLSFLGDFRVG